MDPDRTRNVDKHARIRLILWIDDDPSIAELIQHRLKRIPVQCLFVDSFEKLYTRREELQHVAIHRPIVAFLLIRTLPDTEQLRDFFNNISFLGIISDLEIGGNALAGLEILTIAVSSPSHPELVLYSSQIDPAVERVARSIGIKAIISKHDDEGISRLLDEWLDVRGYVSSLHIQRISAEAEVLRTQNRRLQREKRLLKKELEAAITKRGAARISKADNKANPERTTELDRAQPSHTIDART